MAAKVQLWFTKGLVKQTGGGSKPDITFILDLPAEIGLARAHARRGDAVPDRFETEDLAYHQALNAGFRAIAAEEKQRCVLIEANRPPERVGAEILQLVCRRLHPETAPLTLADIAR